MKKYRLLIDGTEKITTSLNKTIVLVKNDVLVEVEVKSESIIVRFENDGNFKLPLGSFEISKDKLIEI